MRPVVTSRRENHADIDALVWRLKRPALVASTASYGGGVGERHWVLNAQVPHDYQRHDIESHVQHIAQDLGLQREGVGMMTAARVADVVHAKESQVSVHATVGISTPTWAASDDEVSAAPATPGTINIVAFVPVRFSPGGILNALTTATEAKSQALWEGGVAGTGTASDAVCVVCPLEGDDELFGGPRSLWGSRLARAVHRAVLAGVAAQAAK
jgi:adenosylcobinamide hydrolase